MMEKYELCPTDRNIALTFRDDKIGRNSDAINFAKILNTTDTACTIALDGKWGSGKTFFVKQTKMLLEIYGNSPGIKLTDEHYSIKKYMEDNTLEFGLENFQPQVVVYYDAWENDNDTDPILSIIYEIILSIDLELTPTRNKSFFDVVGTIADFFTGKNVTALLNLAKATDPLAKIREQRNIHEQISEFFSSLLKERGNRLVILIDELDRCKPSYAACLLERIKHFFNNDSVTFVFSVNLSELQHTIKQHYGRDFDAYRYLGRFFDLNISLPPPALGKYLGSVELADNSNLFNVASKTVIEYYNLQLREIAKFAYLAKIVRDNCANRLRYDFSDELVCAFCVLCVVPVMIGTRLVDIKQYDAMVDGCDDTIFCEIIIKMNLNIIKYILDEEDRRHIAENDCKRKEVISKKIKMIYYAIFGKIHSGDTESVTIGEMRFEQGLKNYISRVSSLLLTTD